MAIRSAMAIVINKRFRNQMWRLLQHYGLLLHSPYAVLDNVLWSACGVLVQRLLDARPDHAMMRKDTSRNPILGNVFSRWHVELMGGSSLNVAQRPSQTNLGVAQDMWIARSHDRGCWFVLERDSRSREFWVVRPTQRTQTGTHEEFLSRREPPPPPPRLVAYASGLICIGNSRGSLGPSRLAGLARDM